MSRIFLLIPALLVTLGCEEITPDPLSSAEGEFIYNHMVNQVSSELTASSEGPVDTTVPCPVGGTWTMVGTVAGSSVDRSWDVTTEVSDCGIGGYDADGNEVSLTINGGPVAVFSPAPDDTTPSSASGSVSWERESGGSGTCSIFTAREEGGPGGCEE